MKKLLYKILKNDMIKKLSEEHGNQFIDDVMETFEIKEKSKALDTDRLLYEIKNSVDVPIKSLRKDFEKALKIRDAQVKELHEMIYILEMKIKEILPDFN